MKVKMCFATLMLLCNCLLVKANSPVSDSTEISTGLRLSAVTIVGDGFSLKRLFEESEAFPIGSFAIHVGSGFRSDVEDIDLDLKNSVPPLSILLEKMYFKNFSIGMRGGYRLWTVEKFAYKYHYFTLSLRGSYHLNIHPKVDTYIGFGGVSRWLRSGGQSEIKNNLNFSYSLFFGCRYMLKEKFGLFAEYGDDGLTHFHGGLVFKI